MASEEIASGVVEVERLGGFAGVGGQLSNLRSVGKIAVSELREEDKVRLLAALEVQPPRKLSADQFLYRITMRVNDTMRSVELPESEVPDYIRNCVSLELK